MGFRGFMVTYHLDVRQKFADWSTCRGKVLGCLHQGGLGGQQNAIIFSGYGSLRVCKDVEQSDWGQQSTIRKHGVSVYVEVTGSDT